MHVHATWASGKRFDGSTSTGATLTMDEQVAYGGTGAGPTPMEALLVALAGCTGMDVISILKKMRAPLEQFVVEASGERASEHPRVFTAIHLRYRAVGTGLQRQQVGKAVALSLEKYCPVAAMVRAATSITHEVLVENGGVDARPSDPRSAQQAPGQKGP